MQFVKLAAVFLILTLFAALQPGFADPPLPTPVGRVVWVKGTLTATMENKEKRILQKTSVIYLHDTLQTDPTSQAQIVFTDNSLITFREATTFVVSQYQYQKQSVPGKSAGKYIMNLLEGGFRTITGLIAKQNPADYQVNTPVATIGVRGTDYSVYMHNGELYIGWYSGSPCVTSVNKSPPSTVCLDKDHKYAKVPAAGAAPVPLSERPVQLGTDLTIIAATIEPFNINSGGSNGNISGTVTSFCIGGTGGT